LTGESTAASSSVGLSLGKGPPSIAPRFASKVRSRWSGPGAVKEIDEPKRGGSLNNGGKKRKRDPIVVKPGLKKLDAALGAHISSAEDC